MLVNSIDIKNKYDLSAYIYVDRFFFGLLSGGKVISTDSFKFKDQLDFSRQIKRNEFDKLKLEKVAIISHMAPSGLIDYDEFNYDDFHGYFADKYPNELLKIANYFSDKMYGQKLFSTFALNQNIVKLLTKTFPNAQYFHVSKVLSDYLIKKKSDSVLMLLSKEYMSVVSVEDGTTTFSNTFRINGELDAAYYVKSIYESLAYEATKPCYIIDSEADSKTLDTFKNQFPNSTIIPNSHTELIEGIQCVS